MRTDLCFMAMGGAGRVEGSRPSGPQRITVTMGREAKKLTAAQALAEIRRVLTGKTIAIPALTISEIFTADRVANPFFVEKPEEDARVQFTNLASNETTEMALAELHPENWKGGFRFKIQPVVEKTEGMADGEKGMSNEGSVKAISGTYNAKPDGSRTIIYQVEGNPHSFTLVFDARGRFVQKVIDYETPNQMELEIVQRRIGMAAWQGCAQELGPAKKVTSTVVFDDKGNDIGTHVVTEYHLSPVREEIVVEGEEDQNVRYFETGGKSLTIQDNRPGRSVSESNPNLLDVRDVDKDTSYALLAATGKTLLEQFKKRGTFSVDAIAA